MYVEITKQGTWLSQLRYSLLEYLNGYGSYIQPGSTKSYDTDSFNFEVLVLVPVLEV